MSKIAVIDYGMGNLRSVSKALERVSLGARIEITWEPDIIRRADRIVLPGVGAIRDCISELHRLELVDVLTECMRTKPFLGICLGMQALLERSDENDGTECLKMFAGVVKAFPKPLLDDDKKPLKVPHMGWNEVRQSPHPMWKDIPDKSRFYFVHSFCCLPNARRVIAGETHYGIDFASALAEGNVFAVQFHPEKSQHAGLTLLSNFVQWDGTV